MTEATTPGELSSSARIGLFRALRELGEEVPPEPIADWLSGNPKAAAGPRAAAIRVLTAMGARAGASVQPIVVGLLSDDQEEVRIAALPLAGMVRSDAAKAALVRLAQQPGLTSEQRRLAFASLRSYADSALAPVYSEALKTPAEPALRGEILRGLAALDFAQGAEAATSLLTDPSRELRAEAIAVLGQKPASALQVVTLYNAGKLPKEDLSRVIEAARPHKSPELSAAVNELMKSRMLGPSSLDDVRKFQDLVKRHGNADRGKSVYLDAAKANCASCHRLEGSGGAVGPDLTRVWETLSFEKKVESILDPSKEIKEGYNTYKVATKDGRIVSGLLLSDTAEAVTLKDAQGREIRIPVAEVDQKAVDKVSLMPEGVIAHLSLEEFVDLLAFLGDRQAQESLRPKP
jgi:putative heme-binding domain-containing protein